MPDTTHIASPALTANPWAIAAMLATPFGLLWGVFTWWHHNRFTYVLTPGHLISGSDTVSLSFCYSNDWNRVVHLGLVTGRFLRHDGQPCLVRTDEYSAYSGSRDIPPGERRDMQVVIRSCHLDDLVGLQEPPSYLAPELMREMAGGEIEIEVGYARGRCPKVKRTRWESFPLADQKASLEAVRLAARKIRRTPI